MLSSLINSTNLKKSCKLVVTTIRDHITNNDVENVILLTKETIKLFNDLHISICFSVYLMIDHFNNEEIISLRNILGQKIKEVLKK